MSNTLFIFYGPMIVVALAVVAAFVIALKTSDNY